MAAPHFLQSEAWASFQQSLGHKVITREGSGWSYRAILESSAGLRRLYVPYGPTITSANALAEALRELKVDAKEQRAQYLRLQPLGLSIDKAIEKSHHFALVDYSQPSATQVINLDRPPEVILGEMSQNVRNIYHNFTKKGLSYRESTDPREMSHLICLLSGVAAHNQISIHSSAYLQQQADVLIPLGAARLHFIELEGVIIAAALSYRDEHTVYYAHAAADYDHRKFNASTALLSSMIMTAKNEGYTAFDLYGVTTSEDPKHRWAGFTRFKKTFGGETVQLSPTYEIPVVPLPYHLYRAARSISRRLR